MVRLLVVDINATTQYRIKKLLETYPVDIFHASTINEAINKLNTPQYEIDLMITDVRLGAEDGIELIKKVKANHPHLLVVIVTSENTRQAFIQTIKVGAIDYIIKPYDEHYLQNKLLHHVQAIEKAKSLPSLMPQFVDDTLYTALKKAVREDYELMVGLLMIYDLKESNKVYEHKTIAIVKALKTYLEDTLHSEDEVKLQSSNGLILVLPKRTFTGKSKLIEHFNELCNTFLHDNKIKDVRLLIEFISLPSEIDPKQNAISLLAERIEHSLNE